MWHNAFAAALGRHLWLFFFWHIWLCSAVARGTPVVAGTYFFHTLLSVLGCLVNCVRLDQAVLVDRLVLDGKHWFLCDVCLSSSLLRSWLCTGSSHALFLCCVGLPAY